MYDTHLNPLIATCCLYLEDLGSRYRQHNSLEPFGDQKYPHKKYAHMEITHVIHLIATSSEVKILACI